MGFGAEPPIKTRCSHPTPERLSRASLRLIHDVSSLATTKPAYMLQIIEEFDDGRYTVFVPSIPTPLAGAVYVLDQERVHPLDVPFNQALQVVSRWGSGARDLVRAMEKVSNPGTNTR